MDINEKAKLIPIIEWIKTQEEYKCCPITDERSIFYEVSVMKIADLIKRYSERQTPEEADNKALNIDDVSNRPSELDPVLAKIEHINSLGKSTWYEVVYFDKHWRSYNGSNTFRDGEKVIRNLH